jgi:hypothetical protein
MSPGVQLNDGAEVQNSPSTLATGRQLAMKLHQRWSRKPFSKLDGGPGGLWALMTGLLFHCKDWRTQSLLNCDFAELFKSFDIETTGRTPEVVEYLNSPNSTAKGVRTPDF